MSRRPLFVQSLLCVCGLHQNPPPRDPPGPIAAFCPCCGKSIYCYGGSVGKRPPVPTLLVPNFPRVLGTIAAQYSTPAASIAAI